MRCFILAGGFATRLWPLTERRAKPLLPLAGKPLLTWIVDALPHDLPVTVSTNAVFARSMEEWKATVAHPQITIATEESSHDHHKLGAVGALAAWLADERIDDDVLLLTGDNYCGFSFDAFLGAYNKRHPLLAAHDIGHLSKASSFGTVLTEPGGDRIVGFEEKPPHPKTTLISTGCSVLPKSVLPIIADVAARRPDNVGGIFEEMIARGIELRCFRFDEPWFDIGSFESYLEASCAVAGHGVILGEGATIDASTHAGTVVLGAGSAARGSTLRNVIAFERCEIVDCHLEDCILDHGCVLRGIDLTGKMLREGTELVR